MRVKDHYLEAIKYNHASLKYMIEFLVREKKVLSMEDDESAMELYFKPNNVDRMNKLLKEYMQKREG